MIISTLILSPKPHRPTKTPPPPRSSVPTPCLERFLMRNMKNIIVPSHIIPHLSSTTLCDLSWCSIYFWMGFLGGQIFSHLVKPQWKSKRLGKLGVKTFPRGVSSLRPMIHLSSCRNPPRSVLFFTNEWQQAFLEFSAIDSWLQDIYRMM